MKPRLFLGITVILLGALLSVGPQIIFPICGAGFDAWQATAEYEAEHGHGSAPKMKMTCHWTGQAELGAGAVIVVLGLATILIKAAPIRAGLNLAVLLNGVLALLIPTALIGVCPGAYMDCRALSLPALAVLSSILILLAWINLFVTRRALSTDH